MKKLNILLAILLIQTTMLSAVYAIESPLKKYNLYDDVMSGNDSNRERVMDSYNQNSMRPGNGIPSGNLNYGGSNSNVSSQPSVNEPRRNDILRASSKNVYTNKDLKPAWLEGPSFYENPTLASIREKYHRSDFAGCMQESASYVRKHPKDTLGFYYLAMAYTKINDKNNAIAAYEKVIALNSNPMIVKYATNGRNCILGNNSERCYENVNVPELIYPYKEVAAKTDLTPVDIETLTNRKMQKISEQIAGSNNSISDSTANNQKTNGATQIPKITLPFGEQNQELDDFISAPYGSGLSPKLDTEYRQQQLKKIQQSINLDKDRNESPDIIREDIKELEDKKSDLGNIRIAYETPSGYVDASIDSSDFLEKYKEERTEISQINALFGNNDLNDITEVIPYMSDNNENKLSPEDIKTMMMQSIMSDITL